MENKVLSKMQQDMNLRQYEGEKKVNFMGRVIYSALCEWMRFIIMDETTKKYDRKSKNYILSRMKEILINMVESFPESKYWFCTGEKMQIDADELIHQLRDRMLSSGELMEVDSDRNIGLPKSTRIICTDGYQRIIGLEDRPKTALYVGVTRIVKADNVEDIKTNIEIDIESYLTWIYKNAVWNECNNLEMYEFFNPYSKKMPSKSWTNMFSGKDKFILARATLYNNLHEYYLVRQEENKVQIAALSNVLADWKEERRIILALRKKVGNSIWANYSIRGDMIILNLYCGIPIREQVILDTYCWPLNSMTDRQNYVVPKMMWKELKKILISGLGIDLKERVLH